MYAIHWYTLFLANPKELLMTFTLPLFGERKSPNFPSHGKLPNLASKHIAYLLLVVFLHIFCVFFLKSYLGTEY